MDRVEKEKLMAEKGQWISIGITKGGEPRRAIAVPWEATAHAYNMRCPKVYLAPEDLFDEEILQLLEAQKVIGCYIWEPLDDYGFISRFKDLEDLSIRNGGNIQDLNFLSELDECRMLYLQDAKLKDLDTIINIKQKNPKSFGAFRCVCLDNCAVEDLSLFQKVREADPYNLCRIMFSEFLVWRPKGAGEKKKWSVVPGCRYSEYEE